MLYCSWRDSNGNYVVTESKTGAQFGVVKRGGEYFLNNGSKFAMSKVLGYVDEGHVGSVSPYLPMLLGVIDKITVRKISRKTEEDLVVRYLKDNPPSIREGLFDGMMKALWACKKLKEEEGRTTSFTNCLENVNVCSKPIELHSDGNIMFTVWNGVVFSVFEVVSIVYTVQKGVVDNAQMIAVFDHGFQLMRIKFCGDYMSVLRKLEANGSLYEVAKRVGGTAYRWMENPFLDLRFSDIEINEAGGGSFSNEIESRFDSARRGFLKKTRA